MDHIRTIALVPMKPLSAGKSRLWERLSPSQRRALSRHMLGRVLGALTSAGVGGAWVIGGDATIAHLIHAHGACRIEETGTNLNASLEIAFDRALAQADAALYLPGDLPFVTGEDIRRFIAASDRGTKAVIAPERRGDGTNALLMTERTRLPLALGPGSFQSHWAQAETRRLPMEVYDCDGLGNDLDTVDDLERYRGCCPELAHATLFTEGAR